MFKLFGILLLGVAALSGGTYYIVRGRSTKKRQHDWRKLKGRVNDAWTKFTGYMNKLISTDKTEAEMARAAG
jgi:hypothetical protein